MIEREFFLKGKRGSVFLETEADLSVYEEVFVDMGYKVLDDSIVRADVIFDLGAHLGFFSIYAKFLNAKASVYSFEPDKRNFSLMKENIKKNRIKNVFPKNIAVFGDDGEADLFLSEDSHNHSLLKGACGAGFSRTSRVSVRSFEKILDRFDSVDLVKIDVEGAEFEIFRKTSILALKKVRCFYIEYHLGEGRKIDDLAGVLKNSGFEVEKRVSFYDKNMGFLLAKA